MALISDWVASKLLRRLALQRHLGALDWFAIAMATVGALLVATGQLPRMEALNTIRRILPLLLFLGSVTVLADLTARAEVFDIIAINLARLARGNYFALFVLCLAFASATTAFLNLDTTAVLLTPVMIATARRAQIDPVPLAMMTVWVANTASLLLPVSNLTNLLAADRVALASSAFAGRMLLPELGSIAVTMVVLWILYWHPHGPEGLGYAVPARHEPTDHVLFWLAALACVLLVLCVLMGVSLQIAAIGCTAMVAMGFLVRARESLRRTAVPWRLLVLVIGLFLVVQTIGHHGLDRVVSIMLGTDSGAWSVFRAVGSGALLSNIMNNLPSYTMGEAAIPVADHTRLLGLLVGTNVGSIVSPWASLATLLWYDRCYREGVQITWARFAATGAVMSVFALVVSAVVLTVTA